MGHFKQNSFLFLANTLIPFSVLVFAAGFFRYKPVLPDLARLEDDQRIPNGGGSETAPFDKVIFMVVDAMRSDFVYSNKSGFSYVQSLIRSGEAIPFTAHASPPSLTISRIKSMTTGSNPSFLDVILNLADSEAASALTEDTWLRRLKEKETGKMIFYGENTWLQLFPDVFDRSEGVHAFYVPDFIQVDNNVTRHIPEELRNDDWSAFVLHFPGMDHVGHVGGPNSPYMLPKQRQMDGIVRQIYGAMEQEPHLKSTLFVIVGDHGMNEKGNHGGSSPGESSPALVFMSPHLKSISKGLESPTAHGGNGFDYYKVVDQSDIVPTLAGLLGFGIPSNNMGVFIEDFLPLWGKGSHHLQLLQGNGMQLMDAFKTNNPDSVLPNLDCKEDHLGRTELSCSWRQVEERLEIAKSSNTSLEDVRLVVTAFCKHAQRVMGVTAGNLSIPLLSYGILGVCAAVILLILAYSPLRLQWTTDRLALGTLSALYSSTMFSSRYVQEEHHFWYWSSLAWLTCLGCRSITRNASILSSVLPALLQFATQCWNQAGDTQYRIPDLVHECFNRFPSILWVGIAATYFGTAVRLSKGIADDGGPKATLAAPLAATALCLTALIFKFITTARDSPQLVAFSPHWLLQQAEESDATPIARALFSGILAVLAYFVLQSKRKGRRTREDTLSGILELLSLYLLTQSRAHNIPLFSILKFQLDALQSVPLGLHPLQTSGLVFLLAQNSYFVFGNSNAISSIDLTNGYNGIVGYNAVGVPLQVLATNWAGPIWWSCNGLRFLLRWVEIKQEALGSAPKGTTDLTSRKGNTKAVRSPKPCPDGTLVDQPGRPLFDYLALQTLLTAFSLLAFMVACTVLRREPFIWIAHAPKYVFGGLWALYHHLMINVGLCSTIWLSVM